MNEMSDMIQTIQKTSKKIFHKFGVSLLHEKDRKENLVLYKYDIDL